MNLEKNDWKVVLSITNLALGGLGFGTICGMFIGTYLFEFWHLVFYVLATIIAFFSSFVIYKDYMKS